jgi:hypothetical protein
MLNTEESKYAKVWLTKNDFGGLYDSGLFVLHVRTELRTNNYCDEIAFIINQLNNELPKVLEKIWRVAVYNPQEHWNDYYNDDILIYSSEYVYH